MINRNRGFFLKLTEDEIRHMYLDVSTEYNDSPLAINDGWVHQISEFGLLEIKTLLKHFPQNGTLMDIGTGKGIVPRFAHKLGAKVITVDSYAAAGCSAIENVRLLGIEGHFCDVGSESLPAEDATVDCVFFGDVIEHLIHSPKPVLNEIFRVLKPGGVCISTTPNACRLTARLKVLMGYSNWANIYEYFDSDFHSGHHHEYTIEEFKVVFERVGFNVTEFLLYEDSLRNVKIEGMHDLKTQDRKSNQENNESILASLAKKFLLTLTSLRPQLKSNMLLVAKKMND